MRYFLKLAYRGTPFVGWQRQPNGLSVQECIEDGLSKVLRTPISLVGCGRTDTGVHASQYFAHFDWIGPGFDRELLTERLNRLLPPEIAIQAIFPVQSDLHARYGATKRTYEYYVNGDKDPFRLDLQYYFYNFHKLNRSSMQEMASLLAHYDSFYPFCKSHSGVEHYRCQIFEAAWQEVDGVLIFRISANRFLRGMVRLIVGMSLQVGQNKVTLKEVKQALDLQSNLSKSLSAPAHGLYLSEVKYPLPSP